MSVVQAFKIKGLEIRVDTKTPMEMVRRVDATIVHSTRNPKAATTTATTNLMEVLTIVINHRRLERAR